MKIFKILVVALVAMCGLNSCSEDCDHDFIEHDYTKELIGTWSVIGPDYADVMVIKADGTMEFTTLDEGDIYESTARYEVKNNRMTLTWDDGTVEVGRLNVIAGNVFAMILDEESGAGYYYIYCHEDLSDELVGSWLVQTDETSEIHSYYADGTTDCKGYYYHLGEQFETNVTGTYKLVGDILFETVTYGEGYTLSFASRIDHTPGGSPFGDVMTNESLTMDEEEEVELFVGTALRVNRSLDLEGMKYELPDCHITNVAGKDTDVDFMGYTFNFAKLDPLFLEVILKPLFFMVDFPDATHFHYSFFNAPILVEGNKMTLKMSEEVPTLKDVVLYTFQSVDGNRLQLCMDKTAFVNFITNMQAKFKDTMDEQFDITDADAVDAIYHNFNQAVETIKLTIELEKAAE